MAAGRCGHQADGQSVGVADRERAAGRCGNWADGGNMADGWRKAQAGAEVRPAAIGRIGRGGGRADRQGRRTGEQVQASGQAGAAGTGVTGVVHSGAAGGESRGKGEKCRRGTFFLGVPGTKGPSLVQHKYFNFEVAHSLRMESPQTRTREQRSNN
ncbi:hypothetical protein GGX14DRAFT_635397 [Mycena pura]|uniref:Uncharacterized protein n=1 Tax=Mycena pura TaxID=153505 RepID=A0AAD6Y9U1_9AGAR|nr:hypothetical protein GGX14DRAFT_635397 [Mycena pura]